MKRFTVWRIILTTIGLIILFFTLHLISATGISTEHNLSQAVRDIEYCIHSHQKFADHPEYKWQLVRDNSTKVYNEMLADWHSEWVEKYRNILRCLEAMR